MAFTLEDTAVEPGKLLVALNPGLEPVKLPLSGGWKVLLQSGLTLPQHEEDLWVPGMGFVAAELG